MKSRRLANRWAGTNNATMIQQGESLLAVENTMVTLAATSSVEVGERAHTNRQCNEWV